MEMIHPGGGGCCAGFSGSDVLLRLPGVVY